MTELLNQYLTEANQNFELMDMKITAVMESCYRQYEINRGEAELKVMQENGTDSDLSYLYEAAAKSVRETVVKAITAIKDQLQKYFTEMRDRILALLTSEKVKNALDTIEKKLKFLPLLKQKAIMVADYGKQVKCCAEAEAKLGVIKAKLKSGQEVNYDDIDVVVGKFDVEHSKLMGVSAAVSTKLTEAVSMVKEMSSKASAIIKKNQDEADKNIDDCKDIANKAINDANEAGNAAFARGAQALARAYAHVAKCKTEDFFRWVGDTTGSIKSSLASFKDKVSDKIKGSKDEKESPIGESTDGPSEAELNSAAEKAAKEAESKEMDTSEGCGEEDVIEDDPWATLMNSLDDGDVPAEPAASPDAFDDLYKQMMNTDVPESECGPEGCKECGPEKCCSEATWDNIEDIFEYVLGEDMDNMFNDIMNEATGNTEPAQEESVVEEHTNAFNELMSQMDSIFN